ncbi:hypothetical protein LTR05_006192 [Lithohypha guttulata]|uniref:Life-span regulatory factor-domain-containing protein n=1 Tax=Lithohypha guttulata TaxID=1690604 RepID=A0AAN7Y9N8_9EURO|nr:hypothetical protein LTR05_006192 [Lithohypha guttulata]
MSGRSVAQMSSSTRNKKTKGLGLKRPSHATSIQSPTSGSLLGSPREGTIEHTQSEEMMAACFPSYCAMCEKEILYASNPLYCSEACRRKDSAKPLSAANITSTSMSPPTTPPSLPRLQVRTPTGVTISTDPSSTRKPADNHSFKSDLDPTEWKPKPTRGERPVSSRYNSEAFRYLSSFHRIINKNNESNTPTTTASSWSLSTSAGCADVGNGAYDFNTRPLAPRHNRWYSTSVIAGSGIDLVTPHIAPPAAPYMEKDVTTAGAARGGLGAFFGAGED